MTTSIAASKRMAPSEIVVFTPSSVVNSRSFAGFLTVALLFDVNAALAYALYAAIPALSLLAAATFGASVYVGWGPLSRIAFAARTGLPLARLHGKISKWHGYYPDLSAINAVTPPVWVFPRKEHEEQARTKGRSRPAPPKAKHQLCIALHYLNGNSITVAHSDGSTKGWYPTTSALRRKYRRPAVRGIRYSIAPDMRMTAGAILDPLVRAAADSGGTTLAKLVDRFTGCDDGPLMHACRAGVLWGLLQATTSDEMARLYAMVSRQTRPPAKDAAALRVRITPAGRIWLDCSEEALKEAERKRKMERKTRISYEFHAPVQASHIGESFGDNTYHQHVDSSGDLVKALDVLITAKQVWLQPGLEQERATLAQAMNTGQTNTPPVRSAIQRVLKVAGSLVLGVCGNTVYDVLRHFAG